MAGGGKGGSEETTVKLPPELEKGAIGALAGALRSAALPYTPNRGATIAAFSPQQQAAFEGANQAAAAFGMPTGGGGYLPQAETTAQGYKGYSTGGLYDQMLNQSVSPENQAARAAILGDYAHTADQIKPLGGKGGNMPGPSGGGTQPSAGYRPSIHGGPNR